MRTRTIRVIGLICLGCLNNHAPGAEDEPSTSQPAKSLTPDERRELANDKLGLAKIRRAAIAAWNCSSCKGKGIVGVSRTFTGIGGVPVTETINQICEKCGGDGVSADSKLFGLLKDYFKRRDSLQDKWPEQQIEGKPTLSNWIIRHIRYEQTLEKFNSKWSGHSSGLSPGAAFIITGEVVDFFDAPFAPWSILKVRPLLAPGVGGQPVELICMDWHPYHITKQVVRGNRPRIMVMGYVATSEAYKVWLEKWRSEIESRRSGKGGQITESTGNRALWDHALQTAAIGGAQGRIFTLLDMRLIGVGALKSDRSSGAISGGSRKAPSKPSK